jgi:hypothetical protein
MSELITREGHAQAGVDHREGSKFADGALAVVILTTSAAITIAWIVTLYWIAGAFFAD